MGGNTCIESTCNGMETGAGWQGGGLTYELVGEDMQARGESDWVGEFGEGGGTVNCCGLYGIVGPFGGDSAMILQML